MTREEMLGKLHELSFCIFWPDDWDDIGFTEHPIWANFMGYGYFACDDPCRFEKIKNIPDEAINDVKAIIEVGNKYGCNTEKIVSAIIEASDLKGLFSDLDIDNIECQFDFIKAIPDSSSNILYCGEDEDGWVCFQTEQELIKHFEKDASDYYYGESWDDLSDKSLTGWIERLYIDTPDYVLPFKD